MGDHNLNAIIIMQSIVGHGTAFGVATSLMLLAPAQQQLQCVQYRIPYTVCRTSYIVCRRVAVNQSSVKHALASSWTCQLVSEACHPAPTLFPSLLFFLCLSFFLSVAWQLHIHPQLVEIFHVSNRTWSHKSRTGLGFTFYSDSAFGKVFDSEIDQWLRFFRQRLSIANCLEPLAACNGQRAAYNVQRALQSAAARWGPRSD